jgi:hypothetical protein
VSRYPWSWRYAIIRDAWPDSAFHQSPAMTEVIKVIQRIL